MKGMGVCLQVAIFDDLYQTKTIFKDDGFSFCARHDTHSGVFIMAGIFVNQLIEM
jgi:hypothetical protein